MRLTTHSDYALRVLLYLHAQGDELVRTEQIADAYGISSHHLNKIVTDLGRAGYLDVKRGRHGGIRLGRPPDQINIGALVREVESSLSVVECLNPGNEDCVVTPACGLKSVFVEATEAFLAVLDQYTLARVVQRRATALRKLLSI